MQTNNKNVILDVGIVKKQKQELHWRVSVLPIPAFHHCELYYISEGSVSHINGIWPLLIANLKIRIK